ncbi:MAG: ABC transporter permease [Trebonia sp.]
MTATGTAAPAAAGTGAPSLRRRTWWSALVPLVILAVVAALLGYVHSIPLDSIEQRNLTFAHIEKQTWQHIELTVVSTVLVLLIAIPLGIVLSRKWARVATPVVLAITNIGQSAPAVGVIVLLAVVWKIGFWTAVVALVAYSILPSLRNTMVGLQQIDPALVDAGRGIGMSSARVLGTVELPLAVPVILAGVRTTLVLNVGTAAIATLIGGGGLGDLIVTGIENERQLVTVVGCVLIAALALIIDWLGGLATQALSPKGLS